MPCMMNGMPVPGAKGSCPMGSTWVEDEFMAVNAIQNDASLNKAMKTQGSGNFLTDWYNMKGTGVNPQSSSIAKGMNALGNYKNYFVAGLGGNPQAAEQAVQKRNTTEQPKPAFMNDAQRMQQLDSSPKEPKKLSAMAGLMENMRNPEWWGQSMSGLPGDTRLMRLGQLMNYYGQTPQQRLKNKQPAELWAANEAAAQKNKAAVLAAGAKRADEIYGKKSIEDLATDVLADVKEMFGDRMFTISSNPDASDDDAMASLASQVATNIKAITLAYPDKTPGEVRKLALEQLMRDRDLDDLR